MAQEMLYYAQKLPLSCTQPSDTEEIPADMLERDEVEQHRGAEAMHTEQDAQSQGNPEESEAEQEQNAIWEIGGQT